MRIQDMPDQHVLGAALVVLGLSLAGAGAGAAMLALEHMALTGPVCGPSLGHCTRCVAAMALLVAALGVSGTGAWLRTLRSAPCSAT